MFERTPQPRYSPWGNIQDATERAPGIWSVSTAGHGGFMLSDERAEAMPAPLLIGNWLGGNKHFEEDCDWARPVVAFADEFDDRTVAAAFRTLRGTCAEHRAVIDYLDAHPARVRAEGYEAATVGMWEVGGAGSGRGDGWSVMLYQKGSTERRTVQMPRYPSKSLYTTAELDALDAQKVAA